MSEGHAGPDSPLWFSMTEVALLQTWRSSLSEEAPPMILAVAEFLEKLTGT